VGRVRFRVSYMIRTHFLDKNVALGSTEYVDPGTLLILQNQVVLVE